MTLGEYVKEYRFQHGMSMRAFSKISGISTPWISNIEKGKDNTGRTLVPTFKLLKQVADATGVTLDELCGRIDGLVYSGAENEMAKPMTDREILKVLIDELPDEKVHALLSMLR